MTLLFSLPQAQICADAGASLISPFVGRILDWHVAKTGKTYAPQEDPGVLSVKRIYSYYKTHGYQTLVMGASFRNIGEIRELAGIDNITVSPKLLEELRASTDPLERKLDPSRKDSKDALKHHNIGSFRAEHSQDACAAEKLTEGIELFAKDQRKLEALIGKVKGI